MSAEPIAAPELPTHLDVDLSSACNLRCTFCHLSYFDVNNQKQLGVEEFERHFNTILGELTSITLFSKYEPLVCRDFIPIFNLIAQYDIETYFSTNGILLTDDIIECIVGRLTFLTVSITGFTPESYTKHMGSDALERVKGNLTRLVAAKRQRGTRLPRLRISTVGMLDTVGDLPLAVDLAKELEVEEGIQVTSLIAYDKDAVPQMPLSDPARFIEGARLGAAYAAEQGVTLVLQSGGLDESKDTTRDVGHKPCLLPWQRLSVQPNGDVYPCPVLYKPLGNLNAESLEEIWRGPALATFREGVNNLEAMNPDCQNCTHGRHKSVTRPEANDFSSAIVYIGGMTRKASVEAPAS